MQTKLYILLEGPLPEGPILQEEPMLTEAPMQMGATLKRLEKRFEIRAILYSLLRLSHKTSRLQDGLPKMRPLDRSVRHNTVVPNRSFGRT
jgi:hypothetical protein